MEIAKINKKQTKVTTVTGDRYKARAAVWRCGECDFFVGQCPGWGEGDKSLCHPDQRKDGQYIVWVKRGPKKSKE